MRNRIGSSRIKKFPYVDDMSKTEVEKAVMNKDPQYMKDQRLSDEEIEILQKKLKEWEDKKKYEGKQK